MAAWRARARKACSQFAYDGLPASPACRSVRSGGRAAISPALKRPERSCEGCRSILVKQGQNESIAVEFRIRWKSVIDRDGGARIARNPVRINGTCQCVRRTLMLRHLGLDPPALHQARP
jgi:hypothetical protein